MWRTKRIKHAFYVFYTLIKHGFCDQSERSKVAILYTVTIILYHRG